MRWKQQALLIFMSECFIVDRIEEEKITIEAPGGEMIIITKGDVKEIPVEGQVLVRKDNMFIVDYKETEKRKIRINKFMKGMWE